MTNPFPDLTDAAALTSALIRCASVTPKDAGAIALVETALTKLGFRCERLKFGEIENLYARLGTASPNLVFAGHTDVVPAGDAKAWKHDPFAGTVANGLVHGRGATDMKGGIAAFIASIAQAQASGWKPKGSVSLLITGDEEGIATDGTVKVLAHLKQKGETLDHALVGEPTSAATSGDVLKIGRRGSMNVRVTVKGVQGHVAYPKAAHNPIPILSILVARLSALTLDGGTAHFEPSTLSFTSVDVGNATTNVIPGEARAHFNIRFNDAHTPESLMAQLRAIAADITGAMGGEIALAESVSGVSFITHPGAFTEVLSAACARVGGKAPEFSTGGGTSDARFIKDHCPVAELGLPGATMHKTDECAQIAELEKLTKIYRAVLDLYFAKFA